jgi:hypothetical protein
MKPVLQIASMAVLLGTAFACGGAEKGADGDTAEFDGETTGGTQQQLVEVSVHVHPAEVYTSSGDHRALPQTFGSFTFDGRGLEVGSLILHRPITLGGGVIGYLTTPHSGVAPGLPGTVVDVDGTLVVRRPETVQAYHTEVVEGIFTLSVVPQQSYTLEVVPNDPLLPALSTELQVEANALVQEVDLGLGAPIWGTVVAEGEPMEGAEVYAATASGLETARAVTDGEGRYEVRVQPGIPYDVYCAGRPLIADPTLLTQMGELPAEGARVDFDYPLIDVVVADGRVVDASGNGLSGITVRFESVNLDGHDDVASYTTDVPTSIDGIYLLKLPAGDYDVAFLPPSSDEARNDHTPALEAHSLRDDVTSLGSAALTDLRTVSTQVVDTGNAGVADARVQCKELGFGERSWTSIADDTGRVSMLLPGVPLVCSLTPPGSRLELPLTMVSLDPSSFDSRNLHFGSGVPVTGTVSLDGEPEQFAYVELVDETGARLGSGLTDAQGRFNVTLRSD